MSKRRINVYGITIVVFICFLIMSTGTSFVNQSIRIQHQKEKIAKIEQQIKIEKKKVAKLKKERKDYKKDAYVEKIARERLKMVKPGEIIYIDVDRVDNK